MQNHIFQTLSETGLHLHQAQRCVTAGNRLMLSNMLIFLACLVMTYGVSEQFSLTQQVFAHILTIVSAGAFKVGYVVRCVGMHSLGAKSF
ncbi:hypothetical protein [Alteromonas gracilis]|uniref:hypothetical protein n=1 Tax=Alteromonas gracilis TaxID=1479524 RepID=UPI0030CD8C4E